MKLRERTVMYLFNYCTGYNILREKKSKYWYNKKKKKRKVHDADLSFDWLPIPLRFPVDFTCDLFLNLCLTYVAILLI